MNPGNGGWLIALSVIVSMWLAILSLPADWPSWLGWLRPAWLMMILFFWVIELPGRVGLIIAWGLGFFADVLVGDVLGTNGLLFASITYVGWRFHERLLMYSVLQQAGVVFLLVLAGELIRMFLHNSLEGRPWTPLVVLPALISAVIWPFLFVFLQNLKLRYRVE